MNKDQVNKKWTTFFSGWSTRFVITYTVIVVQAFITIALIFVPIHEVNKIILISLVSYWAGYGSSSVGYYFTTNKDQSDKTKIAAAKQLTELPDQPTPPTP